MTVEPTRLRATMARWPTGVSVVTARSGETDAGLTVNAFLSIALRPPTVLISLTADADTTPVVRASGAFVVNVLAHDQRELSERFARTIPPAEKFAGLRFHRDPGGAAVLDGGTAALSCRVVEEHRVADHLLFVAEVVGVELGRDVAPLLFFRSGYAEAAEALRLTLPPPKG